MKRIVGIFAHPGDESVMCGGTLAKYAHAGAGIDLICATNTDKGQRQLEEAGMALGVSSVTFLDYKEGTLASRNPGELEDILFRKLIELVPQIILTYEPDGVDNDPDHKKMTIAATVAFQNYAASAREVIAKGITPMNRPRHPRDVWQISFAEAIEKQDDPKLYYACMPQSLVQYLKKQKLIPEESFDKPWRGTPDKNVTTVIDIAKMRVARERALAVYQAKGHAGAGEKQEFFYLRLQGTQEVFMGKHDRVSNKL